MKRFDKIKTVQLVLLMIITLTALTVILKNNELFVLIATNPSAKLISIMLWLTLGLSFAFLLYDFNSYTELRRENMELDNAIYSDALTGIANRYSIDAYIGQFLNKPLPQDMGIITIEITNLADINHYHGHSGGDIAIQAFSAMLQNASDGKCFIGRNGGNKFVAVFRDCTRSKIDKFLAQLEEQVRSRNDEHGDAVIKYSSGTAFDEGESISDITELIALSDRRAWVNSAGE